MKSLKVLAAFVLVTVILLGGLSLAMAAVTAPISFPESRAELSVRAGTAELQRSGSSTWQSVAGPTEVFPGDTVKTGNDSDASVNLYDQGVLHVAENSTLTLDASVWNPETPDVYQGNIFLEAGGVWSRMFDFVSPDSSFEVRTSSTVATVRGTTFWVNTISDDATRVYVDEHTVEVRPLTGAQSLDVTAGEMSRLDRTGRAANLRLLAPPSGADLELIEKYRRWDGEYELDLQARRLAFAKQVRKLDTESSLYNFQRFSERTRLLLATNDNKRDELRARFMAGRVLDAYIQFAERDDVVRARILLQHAAMFGDETIAARPAVRQAILFFGRESTETPTTLREAIERDPELNEEPQVKIPTAPGVNDEPQAEPSPEPAPRPTTYSPKKPVVAGQTAEVEPQPAPTPVVEEPLPTYEPKQDPEPVPNEQPSAYIDDRVVEEPVILQDPVIYEPIIYRF